MRPRDMNRSRTAVEPIITAVPTPLRLRLVVSITLLFLAVLLAGSGLVYLHALHEVDVELRAAVAVGANTVRNAVDDAEEAETPLRHLQLLVANFDGDRHLRVALLDRRGQPLFESTPLVPTDPAPEWFYRRLAQRAFTTMIELPEPFRHLGSIRLQADARNEVSEVWEDVMLTLTILAVFCALAAALVYWITGQALRPLQAISAAFDRVGSGHYNVIVPETGPRELAQVARGLNRMANQLAHAEGRRLRLERQLAAVQEEERAELARDLHDEIGPLLFAVGADLSVIQHDENARDRALAARIGEVRESVARIYREIKAILGRLRTGSTPLELGLAQAVQNLLAFWRVRYPKVALSADVTDEDFGVAIDDALYHVIMESLSNALRHGRPTHVEVRITASESRVLAIIRDDGAGLPAGGAQPAGFGIAGMDERVRALGGRLSVRPSAETGGVTVTAEIPLPYGEDRPLPTTEDRSEPA